MARFNPPHVSGKYGAPMGRATRSGYLNRDGDFVPLAVLPNAKPFKLVRVRMVDGGAYDSGGAYWGLGEPLYYFEGPLSDIHGYVRGRTRDDAKQAVIAIHEHARFWR